MEDCPSVCRQCKPDDPIFTSVIFGTELETDCRYIKLDCGHTFESKGLDNFILAFKPGDIIPVTFKACPTCQTPIISKKRYLAQINRVYRDLESIKRSKKNRRDQFT